MLDGGYVDVRWWCKEGSNFVKKMKLTAPRFWLQSDDVNSTDERSTLLTVRLNSDYVRFKEQKSCLVLIGSSMKYVFWKLILVPRFGSNLLYMYCKCDLNFLRSPQPTVDIVQ